MTAKCEACYSHKLAKRKINVRRLKGNWMYMCVKSSVKERIYGCAIELLIYTYNPFGQSLPLKNRSSNPPSSLSGKSIPSTLLKTSRSVRFIYINAIPQWESWIWDGSIEWFLQCRINITVTTQCPPPSLPMFSWSTWQQKATHATCK